jgi:hypothetical protein
MRSETGKIGQLHIVSVDVTEMSIIVEGHGKIVSFKFMFSQRENLVGIAGIMERDAHT